MQETNSISEECFPKMYLHAKSTAYSISLIIECFDIYVFGEQSKLHVEKWGVTGFSMGGITAALAHTIG
jgi:dienelactone hydrolase